MGAEQGIYVESSDGRTLLAQAAATPVHPASVSKLATTLALLRRFGPEHRFTTTFSSDAPVRHGTLEGDLWVASDGDPYFVDENAILIAARLNSSGIQQVRGRLSARGTLIFDWKADPGATGLRRAMSGHVSQDSWQTVRQVPALQSGDVTERPPHVVFQERNSGTSPRGHGPVEALVVHRSEPLLLIAKSLNDYSNNIFNLWAESIGGATAVESVARNAVGADMRSEITLGDGAGADPRNRMSPRAAVRLLRALDEELHKTQHTLPDILPVAGIDAGTLKIRLSEPSEAGRVVGKTGTYGDYGASALVGAIATSDEGTVYFAILDHGLNVPEARARQDRFVRALLARLNSTPWDYHADLRAEVARVEAIARP